MSNHKQNSDRSHHLNNLTDVSTFLSHNFCGCAPRSTSAAQIIPFEEEKLLSRVPFAMVTNKLSKIVHTRRQENSPILVKGENHAAASSPGLQQPQPSTPSSSSPYHSASIRFRGQASESQNLVECLHAPFLTKDAGIEHEKIHCRAFPLQCGRGNGGELFEEDFGISLWSRCETTLPPISDALQNFNVGDMRPMSSLPWVTEKVPILDLSFSEECTQSQPRDYCPPSPVAPQIPDFLERLPSNIHFPTLCAQQPYACTSKVT